MQWEREWFLSSGRGNTVPQDRDAEKIIFYDLVSQLHEVIPTKEGQAWHDASVYVVNSSPLRSVTFLSSSSLKAAKEKLQWASG